jgi:hypothetical protein
VGDDSTLDAQLLEATGFVSEKLGRVFNQSTAGEVRYFTGNGTGKITIDDLVSLTQIAVDQALDGTYSTTFATSAWAVLEPYNAAIYGKPYTSLRLLSVGSPTLTTWPTYERAVRITGTWGWPAVPEVIRALCIRRTQEIRLGAIGQARPEFGEPPPDDSWRLWREAEVLYSRRLPAIA